MAKLARMVRLLAFAFALAGAAVAACDDDTRITPVADGRADARSDAEAGAEAAADGAPIPKGARVLGITVDLSNPDFFRNMQIARDAGHIGTADLRFSWDGVEVRFDAGDEAGPDAAQTALFAPALHAARLALESERLSIVLDVDLVDATGPRLPFDLAGKPLDDAAVLTRADALVDYVIGQMDTLPVEALVLGSDVDVAFGPDGARWNAFAALVARASARAKQKRPNVRVGFGMTAAGLASVRSVATPAAQAADVIAVTYVPVDTAARVTAKDADLGAQVAGDLAVLAARVPADRPVLLRAGCPSAAACGSDEATQAAFVGGLFAGWDTNIARISTVVLPPLDDLDEPSAVDAAARAGKPPAFGAVYGSLGLRTAAGKEKSALGRLAEGARTRGF